MTRLTAVQQQERTGDTALMATDAMTSLSFDALCDVVHAHIEARPDVDVDRLQALGNAMCQHSDKVDRENRTPQGRAVRGPASTTQATASVAWDFSEERK